MASLPPILVILALISVTGNSVFTMMLALGLLDIGTYARIAKGGVIAQNDRDYVLAARAMGASDMRLLLREILPNLVPALTAIVPPLMAGLIITEGSLSFLGYGIPALGAELGRDDRQLDRPAQPLSTADLRTDRRHRADGLFAQYGRGLSGPSHEPSRQGTLI